MTKMIYLLSFFLVINSLVFADWENIGNCQRIKVYNTEIKRVVIDDSNMNIFTLDSGSNIKKWDFASGEALWSKNIVPDVKYYWRNSTFLSSDAKTYLTFAVEKSAQNILSANIHIHDINTDQIIDSLSSQVFDITPQEFCFYYFPNFFADYVSQSSTLIFYINKEYICFGSYSFNDTTGRLMIFQKTDTGYVSLTTNTDLYFSIPKIILNNSNDRFYFQGKIFSYIFDNHNLSDTQIRLFNGCFSLTDSSLYPISDYQYVNRAYYPDPPKIDEKGIKLPFSSVYFDISDSNIFLLLNNSFYKYDIDQDSLMKMYNLNDYSSTDNIRVYKTDQEKYFEVIKDDSLIIYLLLYGQQKGSFKVDSINKIQIFQNSKDNQYLFLTDTAGNLYKISYLNIFKGVSVQDLKKHDFVVFPNPTGDYINISVGAQQAVTESIKIFDVFGQEEHPPSPSYEEGELRIDVSALPPGVYFVRVGSKVQKFIKY